MDCMHVPPDLMFMPSVPLAPCCMYYVYALGEHAAGEQQTHAVGGGVVGQADSEAILGQLVGVGSGNHDVASNGGIDDLFTPRIRGCVSERKTGRCSEQDCHLASDILVGEPDDQAILVRVVLVLVLASQAQTSPVVSLSCDSQEARSGSPR